MADKDTKSKKANPEHPEKAFSIKEMLDSQREVTLRLRKEAETKKAGNETDLQKSLKGAESKAKSLEDENRRLKIIVDDLKQDVNRLESELVAEKQASKRSRAKA